MCIRTNNAAVTVLLCLASLSQAFTIRQVGKACSVNGKVVIDGSNFTLSLAGPCVTFKCRDGQIMPNTYGCQRDGKCFPEGDTYNIGCIQRRCGMVNGFFGYERINAGCSIKDVCLAVDQTYQDGCFKYQCKKGGSAFSSTYSLELVDWGCSSGGQCYKEGHVIDVQCRKMECRKVNGVAGFVNTEQGCQFQNTCLKVGGTKVDACRAFDCKKTDLNGIPYYSIDVVDTKCEDANLDCQDPGTFFPFKMGGQVRPNCTCHVEQLNVQYYC